MMQVLKGLLKFFPVLCTVLKDVLYYCKRSVLKVKKIGNPNLRDLKLLVLKN